MKIKDKVIGKQQLKCVAVTFVIMIIVMIFVYNIAFDVNVSSEESLETAINEYNFTTDVVLFDYSVSEDGSEISLEIQVASSMGYIRGFKDKGGGVKPHYLTFYSTFGGLNSSFGSINEIELELSRDNTEIYFNRPGGGYELVLMKDIDTDEWIRPTN